MSKNVKIIIIIAVVAAIAVAAFFLIQGGEKDAFSLLTDSFSSMQEIKKVDSTMNLKLSMESEDPELEVVKKIFNDITIKYDILQDLDNYKAEGKIDILYKDEVALDLNVYIDENYIVMDIPILYEKPFYMALDDYNQFISDTSGIEMKPLDFEKIKEFQDNFYSLDNIEGAENFDGQKYEDISRQQLEGILLKGENIDVAINENGKEKKVACQELKLNFNETQAIDFIVALLKEAQNDEELKNILLVKIEDYMEFSESLMGLELSEDLGYENPYDSYKEIMNDIKENYSEGITEAITELEKAKAEIESEVFKADNIIAIDKSDCIRYLNSDIKINNTDDSSDSYIDSMGINIELIVNSYNKEIEFTNYENMQESCVNLIEILENPEGEKAQEVMFYLYGSFMQEMSTNPLLKVLAEESGVF